MKNSLFKSSNPSPSTEKVTIKSLMACFLLVVTVFLASCNTKENDRADANQYIDSVAQVTNSGHDAQGGMDMIHQGMDMVRSGKELMEKGQHDKDQAMMQRGISIMDKGMDMMNMGKEMMGKDPAMPMQDMDMDKGIGMMDDGMDMMNMGKGMVDTAASTMNMDMMDKGMDMMDKGMNVTNMGADKVKDKMNMKAPAADPMKKGKDTMAKDKPMMDDDM